MNVKKDKTKLITSLLNATLFSIKSVVPIGSEVKEPKLLKQALQLNFGVLIGITGDMKGKLVFSGNTSTFASIGERMYGMSLEGEMLQSFSGELANMIAGALSSKLIETNTEINITTPTILQGDTKIFGYQQALKLPVIFEQVGILNTYLLLDS